MDGKYDLDKIRSLTLSEVIGKSVTLKKEGVEWVAPCPFHTEKTASFKVNDQKGIFYCFGCHEGGDVIDWIKIIHNVEFNEACQMLSEENNIAHVGIKTTRIRRTQPPRKLPDLKEFHEGTEEQRERLCCSRGFHPKTVAEAVRRGYVRFSGEFWVVTDKSEVNGHIRRLDGQPIFGNVKSKSIPDSWARWPLGIAQVTKSTILLTEGEPDFISGLEVCMNGLDADPVGILGGSYIHKQALPFFHGKRVIIAQQNDKPKWCDRRESWYVPGEEATKRWTDQLINSKVIPIVMPGEGNDLNDLFVAEYPMSGNEVAQYFNDKL